MSTLLLRLEGPLQAWSSQGKFGIRDTEREPTKSGVLGLLCAAMGIDRSDDTQLAHLASLAMGVRVDRPGTLLRDYHTVGGGTFRGDPKYTAHDTKNCVPTERYYLQDASFVVGLQGDRALLDRAVLGLHNPHWPLCLGRRSCPLTEVPFLALTEDTLVDALRTAPEAARSQGQNLRMVVETVDPAKGDVRWDVPLSFAEGARRFALRYVQTLWHTRKTDAPTQEQHP
ncbi:MAG: type I-E CRISPR-associated protein Cas5/CasD [Deltaproteobacteria bacterium]|nr:type I-E CRISPR-associated protein Cas5/CasD [Deltaproteobacteria bacterium]